MIFSSKSIQKDKAGRLIAKKRIHQTTSHPYLLVSPQSLLGTASIHPIRPTAQRRLLGLAPLVIKQRARLIDNDRRRRLADIKRVGDVLMADGGVGGVEGAFEEGAPAGDVGGFFV